ncbi:MAG: helix-turn-helix transcriptional regulator [Sandaracinaceae bacterium]
MDDDAPSRWWPIALFAVAGIIVVDGVLDVRSGANSFHVFLELAGSLVLVAISIGLLRRGQARIGALKKDLAQSRKDAAKWREDARLALDGLGVAIDRQFERWQLSPAEREVALLLLKGLSLKEIAAARATSERTARDQARAVYRKADLASRSELAAFFLEDLLLPDGTREAAPATAEE